MAVDVRYRNFFIPRVVKNLKISPWDEEISIPDIRLIRKSLIYNSIKLPFDEEVAEKFLNVIYWVFSSIGLTADVRFGTSSHNLIIKVLRQ